MYFMYKSSWDFRNLKPKYSTVREGMRGIGNPLFYFYCKYILNSLPS